MYFWQIHWKPSLSVVLKISSSSRMTSMPRPRDLREGFTIQALRRPLIACCLLFWPSSTSSSLACWMNFRPRGFSKDDMGPLRGVGSAASFFFFFFVFFFSLVFLSTSLISFSSTLSDTAFLIAGFMGNFFLIISSSSFSLIVTSSVWDGSSRHTCWSTDHSSFVTQLRLSASSGQSSTSSGSVIRRMQIFSAMPMTSMLKVVWI
mmetsp:Transcript_44857/g.116175  ORF Transcript_44857/g.116175 Transcript_44857/m.116175 type:complete len:205 (+) Transcript_44857:1478-2092(+)